jgi:hypothetical protein
MLRMIIKSIDNNIIIVYYLIENKYQYIIYLAIQKNFSEVHTEKLKIMYKL